MAHKDLTLDEILAAAGVDVKAAKIALHELDKTFMGEKGDIPEGALLAWANAHLYGKERGIFIAIGKAWEKDLASGLPEERKWERDPNAADPRKEKAKKAKANAA